MIGFSWKKNLSKAGVMALAAGVAAGSVVLTDALQKGELDLKKLAISAGVAFTAGALESLRNFIKNTFIR